MNKVSLVMTVYNRDAYLGQAISSVLQQTYPNFELIIWDDGSTDNSVAIATNFAQKDSRIILQREKHLGRGLALKKAISLSDGAYLGFIDSDDLLHAEALSRTVAYLDAQSFIGMVYTDCLIMNQEGIVTGVDSRSCIPYSPQRLLTDL